MYTFTPGIEIHVIKVISLFLLPAFSHLASLNHSEFHFSYATAPSFFPLSLRNESLWGTLGFKQGESLMALLMAGDNVFGLMALATADDNHELIAWMTDHPLPSDSKYISRINGLTRPTRKPHPTEGSNNTRAAFLNMATEINTFEKIAYLSEHPCSHTG